MSPTRRRQLLLAVLVLLLVGFGGRFLRRLGSAVGGSAGSAAAASAGIGPRAPTVEVIDLRLQDLSAQPGHYRPGRDPFRYGEVPAPGQPAPDPGIAEAARTALEASRLEAAPPALPPAAQPPPVDVVYLGSFGPRHHPLAVFSDGQEIFNAFEGDVLKEKFIVEYVGYESVDLGFIGFPSAPPQRLAVGG